jgi:hypothetical protein
MLARLLTLNATDMDIKTNLRMFENLSFIWWGQNSGQ